MLKKIINRPVVKFLTVTAAAISSIAAYDLLAHSKAEILDAKVISKHAEKSVWLRGSSVMVYHVETDKGNFNDNVRTIFYANKGEGFYFNKMEVGKSYNIEILQDKGAKDNSEQYYLSSILSATPAH